MDNSEENNMDDKFRELFNNLPEQEASPTEWEKLKGELYKEKIIKRNINPKFKFLLPILFAVIIVSAYITYTINSTQHTDAYYKESDDKNLSKGDSETQQALHNKTGENTAVSEKQKKQLLLTEKKSDTTNISATGSGNSQITISKKEANKIRSSGNDNKNYEKATQGKKFFKSEGTQAQSVKTKTAVATKNVNALDKNEKITQSNSNEQVNDSATIVNTEKSKQSSITTTSKSETSTTKEINESPTANSTSEKTDSVINDTKLEPQAKYSSNRIVETKKITTVDSASTHGTTKIIANDSLAKPVAEKNIDSLQKEKCPGIISLGAFGSIDYTYYRIRSNNNTNIEGADLYDYNKEFTVGIPIGIRVNKSIELSTGLFYSRKLDISRSFGTYKNAQYTTEVYYRFKAGYLELPLSAKYYFFSSKKLNPFVASGVSLGYLITNINKYHVDVYELDMNENTNLIDSYEFYPSRINFSIVPALGIKYNFLKNLSVQTEVQYRYGMNSIIKQGNGEASQPMINHYIRSLGVGFTLYYNL